MNKNEIIKYKIILVIICDIEKFFYYISNRTLIYNIKFKKIRIVKYSLNFIRGINI